jgi:hypothetical protein
MKRNFYFIIFFLYVNLLKVIDGSHFDGGFITSYPLDWNDTHTKFAVTTRFAYRRSALFYNTFCNDTTIQSKTLIGPKDLLTCTGCLNSVIGDTSIECSAYSIQNDWTMGENEFDIIVPKSSNIYINYYNAGSWAALKSYTSGISFGGAAPWNILLQIDSRNRPDTNRPNASPYTFVPPIIELKLGTVFTLKLPTYDADGDVIKCVSF